ncbi:helix-turn-helix domain-containing protein [Glycomyces sp. NPDC048151]|uniref:helix-turn-helix domain-containing protein n=1 Tax=Glycomyces sp. NPDC048151 TaxID=3364002 RepID=UPI003722A737
MLSPLGIDTETQRLYLAMLAYPDRGVDDLTRMLGIDRSAVTNALETLARARLVETGSEDTGGWRAVDPRVGLLTLMDSQQAVLEAQQNQLAEARTEVTELLLDLNAHKDFAPLTIGVDRVIGVPAVRERIAQISQSCQIEVWSFNPGGPQTEAGLTAARTLSQETLDRGIDMRCVYLESAQNEELTRQHVQWIAEQGAQVRLAPSLPNRMLIVDRRIAVVPIDNEDSAYGALIISEPGLVANLVALYGCYWKSARPLGARKRRDENGLSKQDLDAVRLWAQGHTDGSVARKLGVSERTVRRLHDRLTAYLGSSSRFQTGALAVTEGLVEPSDLI